MDDVSITEWRTYPSLLSYYGFHKWRAFWYDSTRLSYNAVYFQKGIDPNIYNSVPQYKMRVNGKVFYTLNKPALEMDGRLRPPLEESWYIGSGALVEIWAKTNTGKEIKVLHRWISASDAKIHNI
ncbi:hypothetical protein [Bacillus cereus group sp. BfR-BA-01349]|uniref:hypothetical protein n=1 Tax=Bacillus cereus group sp. BfR-BA-01349 TaxID=2920312 RepID=UPI001F55AF68